MPGDFLGIENFDRLSRMERTDSIPLMREIIDKGISIVPTMMGIPINRRTMKEQPWLFDYMSNELQRAHAESTRKSEAVGKAKREARQRGRMNGSPINWRNCPGWLDLVHVKRVGSKIVDGHYVENGNAGIVRQIFIWASQGHGGAWIAHKLNTPKPPEPSVKTLRKIGVKMEKRIAEGREPKWHPNVIRQLLRDRRVLGYLQPCIRIDGKRVKEGDEAKIYPPIIEEGLWARVQSVVRQRPDQTRAGRKDRGTVNLVQGLCRCEVCRKGVVIRHQKSKDYLVCEMARHRDCPNRRYFPYANFERVLIGLLNHELPRLLGIDQKSNGQGEDYVSQVKTLEAKIEALRSRRKTLIAEFGPADRDAREVIDNLAVKIEQTEKVLARAREDDLIARHEDDNNTRLRRVNDALAMLNTEDEEAREAARSLLHTELKRRIEAVVLRPDKTIRVDINDGRRNETIQQIVMRDDTTLESYTVVLRKDGSTFRNFPPPMLARMQF